MARAVGGPKDGVDNLRRAERGIWRKMCYL